MSQHLTHAIYYAEIHLLFCSVVWLAAWALTSIPGGSASIKHWIWCATALNFILPLGALADGLFAPHISWASPLGLVGTLGAAISDSTAIAVSLAAIWLAGLIVMLARLWTRIARDADGDPVRGPAVTGLLRSRISLPTGIERLLSERELNSVLMHELTHARRHDNLIRLLYELSLCALWFHPLVWITGSRLALYRELSCDESVIQSDHGRELVSALAKLANSDSALLHASAGSFLSHRLARLTASSSRASAAANVLLASSFAVVIAAGVLGTVAHTACCFVARI